jgi:hypothetical protein
MEIFISWSGEQSKQVAEAFKAWLPKVINAVKPWLSCADIDKGAKWGTEVAGRLSSATFGIVCLTSSNLHSDWILYEAGALSKTLDNSRTCTLLIDLESSDVEFPLAQFQHTKATKDDIFELLKTINKHAGDGTISAELLTEAFEMWWPKLEPVFSKPSLKPIPKATKRTDRQLLEELLELTRNQSRSSGNIQRYPDEQRGVVRCEACTLVQFRTEQCRRCKAPLESEVGIAEALKQQLLDATTAALLRSDITIKSIEYSEPANGVRRAIITNRDGKEFLVHIPLDLTMEGIEDYVKNDMVRHAIANRPSKPPAKQPTDSTK